MSKVIAIIQARMGATRLPGKTMAGIVGKPMLWHVIKRVKEARSIDKIIVATTTKEEDKKIIDFAKANGIESFAGSEEDVLDRFYEAAKKFKADIIVRITADDPLKDPVIINRVIDFFLKNEDHVDYVSNTLEPTFPEGLDVEVFSFKTLERAWREAKKKSDREHVTPYIWNHPGKFKLANIIHEGVNLSHLRWTVDNSKDLEFVRAVYSRLYGEDKLFLMQDVLDLLEKYPHLKKINEGHARFEEYLKSQREEKSREK